MDGWVRWDRRHHWPSEQEPLFLRALLDCPLVHKARPVDVFPPHRAGILQGMDNTVFGPNGPTRQTGRPDAEHLVAVLNRHRADLAGAKGVTIGFGEIVHTLTSHLWAGVSVPATGCHAAVDPLRLRAATTGVNCRRCLARYRRPAASIPGQTLLEL